MAFKCRVVMVRLLTSKTAWNGAIGNQYAPESLEIRVGLDGTTHSVDHS